MFCQNCGSKVEDGLNFCPACGKPVANPNNAQPPVQPTYSPATPPQYGFKPPVVPGKGLGIAGMVCGIVSLVLFCIWYISIPCAIVGAILSALAKNKASEVGMDNGMAKAGIVCSWIALGLAILFIVIVAIIAGIGASSLYYYY